MHKKPLPASPSSSWLPSVSLEPVLFYLLLFGVPSGNRLESYLLVSMSSKLQLYVFGLGGVFRVTLCISLQDTAVFGGGGRAATGSCF